MKMRLSGQKMTCSEIRRRTLNLVIFLIYMATTTTKIASGEIIEFDQSRQDPLQTDSDHSNQDTNHLPLSSLFSQLDKYKCLIEGKQDHCTEEDQDYMKKKFGRTFTTTSMTQEQQSARQQYNNGGQALYSSSHELGKNEEGKAYFGPRYQPIHLALPRREMKKLGHEETLVLNGRTMKIKILSHLPFIFEVENFLSVNETELIVDMATSKKMRSRESRANHVYLQEEIDQRLFDRWDVNYDGFISLQELTNLKELDTLVLSKDDIKELIATVDEDGDGSLSYGELAKGGLNKMKEALRQREEERSKKRSEGVQEAWLWHDEDELLMYENLLEDFHERISSVTHLPEEIIAKSEPIQVTKHQNNSFTACHQDSQPTDPQKTCCAYGSQNCRICRYISIHMFLSDEHGGGELLFPIADNETFTWQYLKNDMLHKCEKTPNAETSNLIVKPKRGRAVFWYNHEVNPYTGWMGQLEARAISGTSLVNSSKPVWSSKMWLNIIGDGVQVLKPWRLGSNWLKPPNTKKEIIETMRNDYFREGELYLHKHRTMYKLNYEQINLQSKNNSNTTVEPFKVQTKNDSLLHKSSTSIKQNTEKIQEARKSFDLRPNKKSKSADDSNNIKTNLNIISDLKSNNSSDSSGNLKLNSSSQEEKKQKKDSILKNRGETITSPIGPEINIEVLGAPKIRHPEEPLGPPKRPLDPEPFRGNKVIDNGLLKASLLLIDELERDELEIVARSVHDKLQLACIPLIVNPIR